MKTTTPQTVKKKKQKNVTCDVPFVPRKKEGEDKESKAAKKKSAKKGESAIQPNPITRTQEDRQRTPT